MKKNLRKVLALVLVVALAFSMMAVASAKQLADYSDASSVNYKEAVDLVTGLGIMTGTGGTGFDATGTFTREQAAKVICYIMLGPSVASTLATSTSSFKDVAVTRWSAPFIEYCAAAGVINGAGDGNFNPTAPVTGSAMAKMLLTAIGYGAKGEYTGANWEINTLVKAQTLGILNTGVNYTAAATREQVAKYVFNVLTKTTCFTVTYNAVTGTYASNAVAAGATPTDAEKFAAGLGALKFSLAKVDSDTDLVAGKFYPYIAAHYWTAFVPTVTVSAVYSDDTVLYTSTNGDALTGATGLTTLSATNAKFKAALDDTYAVYYNGALQGETSAANVDTAYSGKAGTIIQLIDNGLNGKVDVISVISKTAALLTAAPTVDSATGTVTINGVGGGTYTKGTLTYPAGLAKSDVVSYVAYGDAGVITYVEKDTKVTGQMTASTAAKITLAGTVYTLAGTPATNPFFGAAANNPATAGNYNVAATAWLDSNGYMVYIAKDVATVTYTYGLVVGYEFTAATALADSSAKVRLYTADGKVAVYDVAADKTSLVVEDQNYDAANATLVSYVIGADGKVTLTTAGTASAFNGAYTAKSPVATFDSGTFYITASTEVIYFNTANPYNATTNKAAIVTGYSSTAASADNVVVSYVLAKNAAGADTSNIAVVLISQAPTAATSANYGYLLSTSYTTRVVAGTAYYDYTLYINGTATTVTDTATTRFTATGLYSYAVSATTGNVTSATAVTMVAGGGAVSAIDSSYVYYTNGSLQTQSINASTLFYKVTATGVTATAAPTLTPGTTTHVTYIQPNAITATLADAVYYTVTTP